MGLGLGLGSDWDWDCGGTGTRLALGLALVLGQGWDWVGTRIGAGGALGPGSRAAPAPRCPMAPHQPPPHGFTGGLPAPRRPCPARERPCHGEEAPAGAMQQPLKLPNPTAAHGARGSPVGLGAGWGPGPPAGRNLAWESWAGAGAVSGSFLPGTPHPARAPLPCRLLRPAGAPDLHSHPARSLMSPAPQDRAPQHPNTAGQSPPSTPARPRSAQSHRWRPGRAGGAPARKSSGRQGLLK